MLDDANDINLKKKEKTFPISCITEGCGKKNYSYLIKLSVLLNVLLILTLMVLKIRTIHNK